jgi:hypothetical protein
MKTLDDFKNKIAQQDNFDNFEHVMQAIAYQAILISNESAIQYSIYISCEFAKWISENQFIMNENYMWVNEDSFYSGCEYNTRALLQIFLNKIND